MAERTRPARLRVALPTRVQREVRHSDFLVDRPLARDVYVPYEAVQAASGDRVFITVPAGEVNDQGWANPELTETPR